jgi:hypothetical protein
MVKGSICGRGALKVTEMLSASEHLGASVWACPVSDGLSLVAAGLLLASLVTMSALTWMTVAEWWQGGYYPGRRRTGR